MCRARVEKVAAMVSLDRVIQSWTVSAEAVAQLTCLKDTTK